MKTLLTGFDRFGNVETNPSQLVVEHLAARMNDFSSIELITEVLPTEFGAAGHRITQLVRQNRPQRIICLGLNAGIKAIHLERVALNLDDTDQEDNFGVAHKGKLIVPAGPLAYWSTLPIEGMCARLTGRGIPAVISNHAGTYVCNHVFYLARHEAEISGTGTECGFIHLPLIAGQNKGHVEHTEGLPLEVMIEAVKCCLNFRQND